MQLEDLDTLTPTDIPPPDMRWVDPIHEPDQATLDVQESIDILTTVKTLLDYVANPDLVKTITKRERDNLNKTSERVRMFLAEVVPTYSEEGA